MDDKLGVQSRSSTPLHSVHSTDKLSASDSAEQVSGEETTETTSCIGSLRRTWRVATQGTVVSSIFILLTTCVGAGTLSLPYGFTQGGLIFSSIVFFVIMVMSIHIGTMLFASKRYAAEVYPGKEVWGYADLAQIAYGPLGKIAVLLTIAILLFLSLIAYMIYARDQLEGIIAFALIKTGHNPFCSPFANCAILMCIAFIPVFPVTLLRNLSPLQFTSYFSVICVAFVAIAMTVDTGIYWATPSNITLFNNTFPPEPLQLAPISFNGSLTVISYCSLSFVCHFNLLPLQKELKGKVTKLRLYTIIVGTIVIAYVLYNIVIFAGYFRFFDKIKEDVILSYPRDNHLILAARVALFFMLATSYPVLLHPTRASINSVIFLIKDVVAKKIRERNSSRSSVNSENITLLKNEDADSVVVNSGETKIPTLIWFCETFIIFTCSFIPASFIPNVGYVWNFVGSIGGVLVLYIYPSACYLKLRIARYRFRSHEQGITILSQYSAAALLKELIAWAILITGLLLLVVENYQAIVAVIQQPHESSGQCFQLLCTDSGNVSLTHEL